MGAVGHSTALGGGPSRKAPALVAGHHIKIVGTVYLLGAGLVAVEQSAVSVEGDFVCIYGLDVVALGSEFIVARSIGND